MNLSLLRLRCHGIWAILLALLAVGSGAVPAVAQQGSVAGRVTDANTLRPLNAVQVYLPGQEVGALTNPNGTFRIEGVRAGQVTVEAQLIGFATVSETVAVVAGQVTTIDFQLHSRAINLDEMVVTGVGAPTQRRRLGPTVASISSASLNEAPIASVTDALVGRVPGLAGTAFGESGAAAKLLLRGTASLSQRNEPLIYVDGIRMDNRREEVAGLAWDRLGDINPADIDRIEIIKGAAAATLLGTEASSGVIQIFTKRGVAQAPVYTFQIDQQAIHLRSSRWPNNAGFDARPGQLLQAKPADVFTKVGLHQNYAMSVRGGSRGAQFYASARLLDEQNAMPNSSISTASARSAFDFTHSERLRSKVDLSVARSNLEASWPDWSSIASAFLLANPVNATEKEPHGEGGVSISDQLKDRDNATSTNISASAQLAYDIRDNVLATFKVGRNEVTRKRVRFAAEGEVAGRPGVRQIWNTTSKATTIDLNLTWDQAVSPRLKSSFTVGGQSFFSGTSSEFTGVQDFASPTLRTMRGGSSISGVDEFWEEVINAGVFMQEQVGLDERLFLTGGVRVDGNSAFGQDFGLSTYPKVGLSWVVSDYDFWNVPSVTSLRLRGAIGTSGLQPGAFDAQRMWQPGVFAGGLPMVTPSNLGNPDLRPERSTEREFGIEAELFHGRVGVDFVYFDQKTTDALLPRSPAPSTGFVSPQLDNIGQMSSRGIELLTDFKLVERQNLDWDVNVAYTTIDQTVDDMGGIPGYRIEGRRRWSWIRDGFRPGVVIAPVQDPNKPYSLSVPAAQLTSVNQIQANMLKAQDGSDSLVVMGNSLPTWTLDFGTTVRFGGNLAIKALFAGAGGFIMSNETEVIRSVMGINEFTANVRRVLQTSTSSAEERAEVADEYGRKHPTVVSSFMEDGKFVKLSELSLNYTVPSGVADHLGLGHTTLMVGARNLFRVTGWSGLVDPGSSGGGFTGTSEFLQNIDYISAPSPQRYVFSIRTTVGGGS